MRAKLSELGTVITGNTPSKQESRYWASSDIPFIKPDVINQDGITELQAANEYISEIARSKARIVEKSVVLVTCIGSIGKICLTGRECAFNQQINAIIPNDKVLPEYLAYCIYYNRLGLIELANAPVVPIINKRQFENFSVNIEENIGQQGSIVTILKAVDRLIYYRHKQLQKLDELVKARFIELFGDPQRNPHGYKHTKLSDIATYYNGLTYKPENVAAEGTIVLRSSNIQNSRLDFADTVRVDCAIKERLMVQKNDILMCSRNGSAKLVGKVALIKDIQEPMSFGAFMMIIRSHYFGYLMTYFQMDAFRQQIKTGATTTINQITGRMLDDVTIPLPPMSLVDQFATFVEQTDKSKLAVQKGLQELEILKKSLMQQYFG